MKNNFDISILDGLLSPNNTQDDNGQYKIPYEEKNVYTWLNEGMWEELAPGDPWYEETLSETAYIKRIKQCFSEAYRFLETNRNPQTQKDWERMAGSLSLYKDPLTVGLVCECIKELEREHGKKVCNENY